LIWIYFFSSIDTGQFELHGADNPGIVHSVTKILAKHRLNIDEMKTFEDKSAPHGGLSLFHMGGVATSPAPLAKGFDPKIIREELEELGDEMNCDITLEDVLDDEDSASFYAG
jgi:glycine cleavage system regulatory protein